MAENTHFGLEKKTTPKVHKSFPLKNNKIAVFGAENEIWSWSASTLWLFRVHWNTIMHQKPVTKQSLGVATP